MQPLVVPTRGHLTASQVEYLLREAPTVGFTAGCELLDGLALGVLEDITAETVGGSVTRGSYNTLHGSATLSFERELPWSNAIVRPYITLTDGTLEARFNLGAYYTHTPGKRLREFPVRYGVQCYDILSILDDPVGDAYAVAEGATYLSAVENILMSRGVEQYVIDQAAAATVLPTDRVWIMDERTTWLTVVNDLLGAIGYRGIYSDWDGLLRCEPYLSPRDRGPEWVYDAGPLSSLLGNAETTRDFYDAPNRWVFYRSNNTDGGMPVEGAGRYTYVNEHGPDTSVDARGREITKVVPLDVADQAALVSAAQSVIDADMSIPERVRVETFAVPLHWHMDVVYLDDPEMGTPTSALVASWTLPLDGSNMQHEWTVIR